MLFLPLSVCYMMQEARRREQEEEWREDYGEDVEHQSVSQ